MGTGEGILYVLTISLEKSRGGRNKGYVIYVAVITLSRDGIISKRSRRLSNLEIAISFPEGHFLLYGRR